MRNFVPVCSLLAGLAILGGCAGGGTSPLASTATSPSLGAQEFVARASRFHHAPPHPPKHRHAITGADRARAMGSGWQPVTSQGTWSNGPFSEVLLTDGSVLVHDYCSSNWNRLVPDSTGSYVNGTWQKAAAMSSTYGPLYDASAVLPDGKVLVNGGEYNFCNGDETPLGAIYDPVANSWTSVSAPSGWSRIGDAQSVVLTNGTFMLGNCCTAYQALYNESNSSWTQIGTGKADVNSEEGWTLLRSGNVLTADVSDQPNSEEYNPTGNAWASVGNVPVRLADAAFEIGPQTMLMDDKVWVAGATGLSATFNEKTGTWTQGPSFPIVSGQQLDVADGPASLMVDGKVMVVASPGDYNSPATFFVYNGKKLKEIAGPPGAPNDSSYNVSLLVLPNGQVMETDFSSDVEIYTPPGHANRRVAPVIGSVPTTLTHGTTYQVSGVGFNGVSQTNFYGDDDTQAENYPLVRIVNNSTGNVVYARTHGVNFMGIGSTQTVTTSFDVPASIGTGASKLYVVTNGIASKPVAVTVQ